MRGRALTLVGGVGLAMVLGACGGSSSNSSSTTLQPLGPTVFVTIPPTSTTLSANVDTGSAAAGDPGSAGGQGTYTVQSGDYPLKVAKLLGCSWDEIAAYNDIADPAKFAAPGKVLNVPVTCAGSADTTPAGGGTATTAPTTTKTTVATSSKTTTTVPADGSGTYVIKAGDTLSGIAKNFNTKMATIVTLNGWSDGIQHNLIPGKTIKVPAP